MENKKSSTNLRYLIESAIETARMIDKDNSTVHKELWEAMVLALSNFLDVYTEIQSSKLREEYLNKLISELDNIDNNIYDKDLDTNFGSVLIYKGNKAEA